jgi:hypothetical protein
MKRIHIILGKVAEISGASALILVVLMALNELRVIGTEQINFENASLRLVNSIEHIPRNSHSSITFFNSAGAVQVLYSDGKFAYFSSIGTNTVPSTIEVTLNDEPPKGELIKLREHIPQSILSKVAYRRRDSWLAISDGNKGRWRLDIEIDLYSKRVDWLLSEKFSQSSRRRYWCASKTEMYQGLPITGDWQEGPVFPNCRL